MQAKMQSGIKSLRTENNAVSGVVGSIVTTGVQMVQSPFKELPSEMLRVRLKIYCKILSKNICVNLEYVSINSAKKTTYKAKGKAVPLQARRGPEGSRKLRFPDFVTTAQDGGKVVSLTQRPPLSSGNTLGTHFCYRLSRPPGP